MVANEAGCDIIELIDLLDAYDDDTPTDDEKEQMNVYQPATLAPTLVYLPLIVKSY